ncbi:MAG: shikimate dehydrogenase [Myxococcales bacterium]|nr:shikimate dehydrogenase [Myxococcales bacterium]
MIISGKTRLAAVLGDPASHSKSPALHNAGFAAAAIDAVYVAMTVSPSELLATVAGLRAIGLLGASVTVPHKTAVMQCCDELSPSAEKIGAVNTLEFRSDGRLVGHNTDAPGYVRAFEEDSGEEIAGRRVVLLGGGGAARAVAVGVAEAGATSVKVVARTPSKVGWTDAESWTSEKLEQLLASCDLLIDCTSLGLSAENEKLAPCPMPLKRLPKDAIVSSLIYHRKTALIAEAGALGLATVDGSGMLLHQGAIAFEIWTGCKAPIDLMKRGLNSSD